MVNQKTASAVLLGIVSAGLLWASNVIPAIVPAMVPAANKVGNSAKFQLAATSGPVSGDCASFDANLNITGAGTGTPCGSGGGAQPFDMVSGFVGNPSAGATVFILSPARAVTFAANFSGSVGTVGTNPTSTALYTVTNNGVTIGTVSISTGGAFTFATTGGTSKVIAIGDRVKITAPSPADSTLADITFTLAGTR